MRQHGLHVALYVHAADVVRRAQARRSVLDRGTAETLGIRRDRCARETVTSHAVTT